MERWIKKPWGATRPILKNDQIRVEQIRVDRGGYCSIHYHEWHPNAFFVLRGELLVVFNDRGTGSYPIVAGDHLIIQAGMQHQFIATQPVVALEAYTGTPDHPADVVDIVRLTSQGGVLLPRRLATAIRERRTIG